MNLFEEIFDGQPMVEVSDTMLRELWKNQVPVTGFAGMESGRVFERAFLQYTGSSTEETELAFLKGGWTFGLKAGLVKTALSGAFMAGMFNWIGFESVGAAVLPSILPFLFELEKIELTKKEETLLAQLTVRDEVKQHLHSSAELYKLLPAATRKMVNELDFLDFLEKLDLAGHLEQRLGDQYQVSEKLQFKLTIV